jgi:biotin carboxylase
MKVAMVENKIPTAKHRTVNNLDEIVSLNFQFPLVVKPADSNSSKGVRKDLATAMSWYEESASNGNKHAAKRMRALGAVE